MMIDEKYDEAVALVGELGQASISLDSALHENRL